MRDEFVIAASVNDIDENESKAFDITGNDILVCNTKEGFFAVENQCTHQLHVLEGGKIRGCFIFCPLHGQRFSLKDGAPLGQLTDKPLKTYPVKIEGEHILINPQSNGGAQD